MPYLIDGHNLIPKLGLTLASPDDELDLIARLLDFCRLRRVQVEVYFDGAPLGLPATRKSGAVTAHFVRLGSSADAAVEDRLARLGGSARNWTVVSSDRRLQIAAQAVHAQAMPSEAFAREMTTALREQPAASPDEAGLSPEQVEEWLRIFKKGG